VPHAFAVEPLANTRLPQEIDRPLFEHAGAHAFNDVLAAAVFDDDRIDAVEVKKMAEHQARRPGADDTYLSAGGNHCA
jgi:hypothetical protein